MVLLTVCHRSPVIGQGYSYPQYSQAPPVGQWFGPGIGPVYATPTGLTPPPTTTTKAPVTAQTRAVCEIQVSNCVNVGVHCESYCFLECDRVLGVTAPSAGCPNPQATPAVLQRSLCRLWSLWCTQKSTLHCQLFSFMQCDASTVATVAPANVTDAAVSATLCDIWVFLCGTKDQVACDLVCRVCSKTAVSAAAISTSVSSSYGTGSPSVSSGPSNSAALPLTNPACLVPNNDKSVFYLNNNCVLFQAQCNSPLGISCAQYNWICLRPQPGYQASFNNLYFNPMDTRNRPAVSAGSSNPASYK
ncbi:hypothetical protein BV898_04180 [Hypsibius exemplaris]|uniref:Uncharacterized protein n=1 Tax=Hypsibius exemplaris TaxID=2072580 RepID=A0A1W0X392_HYPEX|nr:hypothetical protein BV898_04180 [Hypsibius exemplaris]